MPSTPSYGLWSTNAHCGHEMTIKSLISITLRRPCNASFTEKALQSILVAYLLSFPLKPYLLNTNLTSKKEDACTRKFYAIFGCRKDTLTLKIPQNPKWVASIYGRLPQLEFLIFFNAIFTINPINRNLCGDVYFIAF
jgi:hypothetical protein